MKKYSREDQRAFAVWAADCAERVLPLFEKARPKDDRPRKALTACRRWARTGIFRMADIRTASLGAHAAARGVKDEEAACAAARAAGQAVATAHVPQHAFGAAYYAIKALVAADAGRRIHKEIEWQTEHLPAGLRKDWEDWKTQRFPKKLRAKLTIALKKAERR